MCRAVRFGDVAILRVGFHPNKEYPLADNAAEYIFFQWITTLRASYFGAFEESLQEVVSLSLSDMYYIPSYSIPRLRQRATSKA